MNNSTEKEWSRVNRIRAELSGLPFSDVATRIDQLRREGESTTVIAMLEFHYRLSRPIELRPGRRLANRYTIKRKIGEGGMGVVYEAVQDLTQQEVALKVIHPSLVSPPLIKRFREEIRTLGKLQHDHIVHVFDADYDRNDPANHNQDQLFYAMQLVQGLPLIRWVNESCPTVEAQLECFIQICEAVDYAHRRGVVHRDLKPDNILVDAGGRPAIMDFGLAQIADLVLDAPEGSLAPDGQSLPQVSGTPAFMSAERWEGLPGGVPADVFALGVLLHEMLTGIRPWNVVPNASIHDLRLAICNFTADQLEEHPALTAPFTRLLCSMLAPDPKARPATAAQVASAIRSIVARRRLRQRIRRGVPIWVGVTVAVGSVIATQSYYAWLKAQERDSEHRLRQASQIVEQRSKVDTLAQVITLLPKTPRLRHSQDQWREVVLEAMANWNINPRGAVSLPSGFEPKASDQKGTCFFGVNATGVGELIEWRGGAWVSRQFPGQQDFLRVRINSRRGELAALTRTAGLVVWRWNQNQPAALLPAAETTSQFEFSQDGRYLACSVNNPGSQGDDSEKVSAVRIFETETLKEVAFLFRPGDQPEPGSPVYLHSRPVAGMAFSPDGEHLAVWSHESLYLLIWEWSKERLVHFAAHRDRLVAAAWRPAPEEGDVATIQANGQILFWSLSTTPKNGVYLSPEDALEWGWAGPGFDNQLAWTPRGEALAAANAVNQSLEIFCPDAGAGQFSVRLGDSGSRGMRWLSGGLVTHGKNHQEWIPFDSDPPVRRILRMPNFRPSHLAFNPAGTLLAAADNSRAVLISTITGKTLLSSNMPLSGPVTFDAISGELWVYDKINGPTRWAVSGSGNELTSLVGVRAIGPSYVGQLAATGGHLVYSRGTNIFVSAKEGAFDFDKAVPDIAVDFPPKQLAISANGQQVAAIWENPLRAALWHRLEGRSWAPEFMITNATVVASLPEWNRDTPLLISPLRQRTADEKDLKPEINHFGSPIQITPAANVPMVAWLRSPEQRVHLDYLGREACIHLATLPFDRERGLHRPIALSPDGMRLATANSEGEIQLWDLRRALTRLSELRLGIDEINLEESGQGQELSKSLVTAGPR